MLSDRKIDNEVPYAHAVSALATALDKLGARIYRDLHVDSTDAVTVDADPRLTAMLTSFSAYAEECLAVLDDPSVRTVLDTAASAREQDALRQPATPRARVRQTA
jgi:hypothetical protein